MQDIDPIHDHQTSPRLQARFRVNPEVELYMNAGRYSQQQNLYELQLDDGLVELQQPQVADQFSLGVDWRPDAAHTVRLEAYVRDVDHPWRHFENLYNRWVLLPELHADRVELRPDEARAYGTESERAFRAESPLSAGPAPTPMRAPKNGWTAAWQPRPWDQEQSLRLGMNWRPARWQIDVMASWHSGWATNAAFEEGMRIQGCRSTASACRTTSRSTCTSPGGSRSRTAMLELYGDFGNVTARENVGGHEIRWRAVDGPIGRDRDLLEPIPAVGISWTW